jgi:UDP-N-acetylglucosamine acyltransferase
MIHPTAIVHPGARLAASVAIGAYSIIGEHVEVGEGTSIGPHVVIEGRTRIGRENRIASFSVLGGPPQDKKYAGEPTRLEIGDRNTIRECCTFSIGTVQDVGVTRIGNDNWIMAYCHVAHDCQVGDNTIFANNTQLAGHVLVQDFAVLGGFTGVHQFVRIGAHSMTAGGTILRQDLPPYVTASGNPTKTFGVNAEGLRRRGFSEEKINGITRAYKVLYRSGLSLADAQASIAKQAASLPELLVLAEFLGAATRGIVR